MSKIKLFYAPSLPAWECGLKFTKNPERYTEYGVTPCVGVWIEIKIEWCDHTWNPVTPCVGVWIEIYIERL